MAVKEFFRKLLTGRVRPRGICPVCGRQVALTKDGTHTHRHRIKPGSRNTTHHTVRMKDGEVIE